MLAPPRCSALTILADQNPESDTRTPIALVAVLAQHQHSISQLVTYFVGSRWRSNGDGGWIAVLWCNYHPGAISAAHVTTVLVKVVAARSYLTLCGYNRPSATAHNCADSSTTPAAQRTSYDRPSGPPENRARDRVLCRRVLHRQSNRKAQQGRSPEWSIH
jgi:hypothetical protein